MSQFFEFLKRCSAIFLIAIMFASLPVDAQNKRKQTKSPQRSVATVKKDKRSTERKISETSTKIQNNTKKLNRQINHLNSLNADIETNKNRVAGLRHHIDSLGSVINETSDSIKILEQELEKMRLTYATALKRIQPYANSVDELTFIFSSESFSEAYSRIRYIRQFSLWRERKAERIRQSVNQISERRARLTNLRNSQDQAYRKAEETSRTLSKQQKQSTQLVAQLRKEDSALRQSLKEQKRKAAALDRELDRLIAEEQARIAREEAARKKAAEKTKKQTDKKPADNGNMANNPPAKSAKDVASANAKTQTAAESDVSKLTGSFAANKGKLLFPVSGKYKIVRRFGRQPHPTLPHVETDNSGIDIETSAGSSARAVFAGTVSAIFKQDGFNSIVMIRHGSYLSIYAGLENVDVRQGDKVKAGQNIGKIYSDADDGNRTILHFEIRNERQKLNPSQWVK